MKRWIPILNPRLLLTFRQSLNDMRRSFASERTCFMAKLFELAVRPALCSIPLGQAIYCENCNSISNPQPHRCGVCDSEAVLRVEAILNRDPEPPSQAAQQIQFSQLRVVGA
jgi:hypothetical protein